MKHSICSWLLRRDGRRFRVADVDASGEIDFGESVNSKLMLNMSVVPDGDTMAGS